MNYYKIAPDAKAARWDDCYNNNVICVGWGGVGDLYNIENKDNLIRMLEKEHYKGNRSAASLVAGQLWTLRGIKQGDIIIANRGKREVLAVGKVPPHGAYRYDPRWSGFRNENMPHIVPVRWNICKTIFIQNQTQWQIAIVKLESALAKSIIRKMQGIHNIDNDGLGGSNDNGMDDREKQLKMIELRRGQPKFRKLLLRIYERKCCLSGCDVEQVLDAAHIKPYGNDGMNVPQNGLLLRSDLHVLFDLNILKIHPETLRIKMDGRLIGTEYYTFDNKPMRRPINQKDSPCPKWLKERWSMHS